MNIFKKKTSPKGVEREIASLQLEVCCSSTHCCHPDLSSPTRSSKAANYKLAGNSCTNKRHSNPYSGASKAMAAMNKV
ncbi:hypothetical protein BHE74_00051076 [Ensete ventricosum]|nr:hypothetical protein GW17_00030775 [Ensete ventricosum]RWW43284.1 hypothetical protein BHE74_00051076 [Ensete ventricosum]